MRTGKYVSYRLLKRLVWAWLDFIEDDDGKLDELYLALRQVIGDEGDGYWPTAAEQERIRALRATDEPSQDGPKVKKVTP